MKYFNSIICLLFTLNLPSNAFAECQYTIDLNQAKIQWTAFKTTDKAAVKGTFKNVSVNHNKPTSSIYEVFVNKTFNIDTSSVDSGNPARDQILIASFFSLINGGENKISGSVTKMDSKQHGELNLELKMNNKITQVPMKFSFNKKNIFIAKGTINLLKNFSMQKQMDSIHKACELKHTGKDKKSITWPDVNIMLTAHLTKKCS